MHGTLDRPAYRPNSYFAQYEYPNIPASAVPVSLMVVRNLTAQEYCGHGSLKELQSLLNQK